MPTRDQLLKFRALVLCAGAVLCAPILFVVAIIFSVTKRLFRTKMDLKDISNEIAVVTGGAQGLGKAISIELAKQGCHVAIVDIDYERATETATYIAEQHQVRTKSYKVDVTDFEQVRALNADVCRDLGTPTILINNAGILLLKDPIAPDWRDVQRMINVNFTAHFWTNQVFLPKMKELNHGHIVAISSLSGLFPLIYNGVYTSTKSAIRGLMRNLRQDLKSIRNSGVHATTVMPIFLTTHAETLDMYKTIGGDSIYPAMDGAELAELVVAGMRRNEGEIYVPGFFSILYRITEILPIAWQDIIFFILMKPLYKNLKRQYKVE